MPIFFKFWAYCCLQRRCLYKKSLYSFFAFLFTHFTPMLHSYTFLKMSENQRFFSFLKAKKFLLDSCVRLLCLIFDLIILKLGTTQKQPSRGVLRKRCSENVKQIYKRTPMTNCDFNTVALQYFKFWTLLLKIHKKEWLSSKTFINFSCLFKHICLCISLLPPNDIMQYKLIINTLLLDAH